MTKAEFIRNVTDWDELIDFCNEESLDICTDVISNSDIDSEIDNRIPNFIDANYWYELCAALNEIPREASYYIDRGCLDLSEADEEDFEDRKYQVIEYMDENECWDADDDVYDEDDFEESEDEEFGEDFEEEPEDEVIEEPFGLDELLTVCNGQLKVLRDANKEEKAADDKNFRSLFE